MTFNRLAVVVGVLAMAGVGYSAGKAEPAAEQNAAQRSKAQKRAARAEKRKEDRKGAAGDAKKEPPKVAGVYAGKKPVIGPSGTFESITIFGTGFEDGATVTFFDEDDNPGPSVTGTLVGSDLICEIPPHEVGFCRIRVSNADGWPREGQSENPLLEYYDEQITVTGCNPTRVQATISPLRGPKAKAAAPVKK